MRKIFILFLLFISACGYQPLYKVDKNLTKLEINETKILGNAKIGKKIIDKLPFTIDKNNELLNKISIESKNDIIETSKNSKGQVTSYRTVINVNFKILNKDNEILSEKECSYNSDENKFKFKEYQNKVEQNLVDKIVEDIIIDLNS